VACSIEVPENWFWVGATLQIALPRLLACARCDGGGCDACERRGAFEQTAAGTAKEVAVVLPVLHPERCVPVRLRLPALGAQATEQGLPAGHLLLTVVPHAPQPGWAPAPTIVVLAVQRHRRTLRNLIRARLPEELHAKFDEQPRLSGALAAVFHDLFPFLLASDLLASQAPALRWARRCAWVLLALSFGLVCFKLFHRSH
jgi:hypothetical protein